MIAIVVLSLSGSASSGTGGADSSGAAGVGATPSTPSSSTAVTAPRVTAPDKCPSARKALRFYQRRHAQHRRKMGAPVNKQVSLASTGCPRYLAKVWKQRAYIARQHYETWLVARTLRDYEVRSGNRAWLKAVDEAQRPYPGTAWWLKSCSSTEGGWGRWVPNSQGFPPGGWLQFYESTFWRMWATAKADVQRRGYFVPRSASSWYSPLGQALAGAWGLTNGRRHEWSSSGC